MHQSNWKLGPIWRCSSWWPEHFHGFRCPPNNKFVPLLFVPQERYTPACADAPPVSTLSFLFALSLNFHIMGVAAFMWAGVCSSVIKPGWTEQHPQAPSWFWVLGVVRVWRWKISVTAAPVWIHHYHGQLALPHVPLLLRAQIYTSGCMITV